MKFSNVSVSGNVSLSQHANHTCIQMDTVTVNIFVGGQVKVCCSSPDGKISQKVRANADIDGLGKLVVAGGIVYLDGRILYPTELAPEEPTPEEPATWGSPPPSIWSKIKGLLGLP